MSLVRDLPGAAPTRPTPFCLTLFFSLLLCLPGAPLLAQTLPEPPVDPGAPQSLPAELSGYPVPSDMSSIHFYLITVDVGDSVWDNFGHTALRVLDDNSNTDLVFNWGVFDVSGGPMAFSWNFFKGIMEYRLLTSPPTREFALYQDQERTVWQERINLSNPQKEILYRRLLWNSEPENIYYDYHYFFDNCTTRVRDYLDEALGGKLRDFYDGISEDTFRDEVRAHYASNPLIRLSLDVLMNSNIDRPMSEWEAMYLPLSLRGQLAVLPSDVALNGERQMLLSDSQVVMQFPPPTVGNDPYHLASWILLPSVLFLGLMLKRIPMSYFATHSRVGLKWASLSYRLMGLLGVLTALFSGVYGLLMLGSWFVSDHIDLHHNVNLLLFWPTDLLGLAVALRWLLFCKPWPLTNNSAPFVNYYLLTHVLAMLAYGVIALMGLTAQSIMPIALYVLPGYLLFTLLFWLVGFEPVKPRTMLFS